MAQELTNNNGLPKIFSDALQPGDYDPVGASDYSATTLIQPPRIAQLNKRHKAEITSDVLDWWYAFRGQAVHSALEAGLKTNPRYIIERKITRFDKPAGQDESKYRRVVAKLDAYDKETQTLSDHKTTTTFIHGKEAKAEWINQLNINALFLEKDGYPVKNVAINAIYMDWRANSGKYKSDDYPATPATELVFPAWPLAQREEYYNERLTAHVNAETLTDDELPLCGVEDMWCKPGCFAVYKPGADRATKLCKTKAEAEQYIAYKNFKGYEIETRPEERTRCDKFCSVNKFCNQYQQYLEDKNGKNNRE